MTRLLPLCTHALLRSQVVTWLATLLKQPKKDATQKHWTCFFLYLDSSSNRQLSGLTTLFIYVSAQISPTGENSLEHSFLNKTSSSSIPSHSSVCFSSVQFSRSVVSNSLRPHELQHARPPCPSPTPGVHSDSRPSSQWCHPAISSSAIPFSYCPQSLPASESFPMS